MLAAEKLIFFSDLLYYYRQTWIAELSRSVPITSGAELVGNQMRSRRLLLSLNR